MLDHTETPVEAARRMYDTFAKGDIDAVVEMLDPQVTWELVGPAEVPHFGRYEGTDEVKRFFDVLLATIEVHDLRIDRITAMDGGAIAEGYERASFRRNGGEYEMRFCHVLTIDNGVITSFTDHLDTAPVVAAWRQ